MHRAYHYVRMEDFRNMLKNTGVLKAHSPLLHRKIVQDTGIQIPSTKFLFCLLDSPEPESWVKTGWLAHFIVNFLKSKYALLSFNIGSRDSVFMLEALPVYNLWKESNDKYRDGFASGRFREVFQSYVDSIIPLAKYSGNFKIPELIVAKNIPLSKICLEKVVD